MRHTEDIASWVNIQTLSFHLTAEREESAGILSDSTSYYAMLGDLYEELDRKKAELERLENAQSDDSEDCASLQSYGGRPAETSKMKWYIGQGKGNTYQTRTGRGQGDGSMHAMGTGNMLLASAKGYVCG